MVILASEDVGLADSAALGVALDAFRAVEIIGLPEASFALSHAAIYLAAAPKSDSVKTAMGAAGDLVERTAGAEVPAHLRSASFEGERAFGYGVGYDSPHRHPDGLAPQDYLPEGVTGAIVFRPKRIGEEADVADGLEHIDEVRGKPSRE